MADSYDPARVSRPPESGSDTTSLIIQLVLREVAGIDNVMTARMNAQMERINAIEKTHELFRTDLVRVPTSVDKAVAQLKELHEKWFLERLANLEQQLRALDARITQSLQALRDMEIRWAKQFAQVTAVSPREGRMTADDHRGSTTP